MVNVVKELERIKSLQILSFKNNNLSRSRMVRNGFTCFMTFSYRMADFLYILFQLATVSCHIDVSIEARIPFNLCYICLNLNISYLTKKTPPFILFYVFRFSAFSKHPNHMFGNCLRPKFGILN